MKNKKETNECKRVTIGHWDPIKKLDGDYANYAASKSSKTRLSRYAVHMQHQIVFRNRNGSESILIPSKYTRTFYDQSTQLPYTIDLKKLYPARRMTSEVLARVQDELDLLVGRELSLSQEGRINHGELSLIIEKISEAKQGNN